MRPLLLLTPLALAAELFYTKDSFECKVVCIDTSNVFCPDANGEGGQCCDGNDCANVDYCSYSAPIDALGLKYWACPH